MNRKVTVVGGAGNVGATVARGVADKSLADVVVIDIADKKAAGVALDILEACPVYGSDARVMGSGDYAGYYMITADSVNFNNATLTITNKVVLKLTNTLTAIDIGGGSGAL